MTGRSLIAGCLIQLVSAPSIAQIRNNYVPATISPEAQGTYFQATLKQTFTVECVRMEEQE